MTRDIVDKFKGVRVAVVGDAMLDRYLKGYASRLSQEAPIPIIEINEDEERLGGAANVAHNVVTLGGSATLFGVTGDDADGVNLKHEVSEKGIIDRLYEDQGTYGNGRRRTTVKTRVVAHGQQVTRFDLESRMPIGEEAQEALLNLKKDKFDAIIVSDYAKGVITQPLYVGLVKLSQEAGIPLIVDPKPSNGIDYTGATFITPNRKEAYELLPDFKGEKDKYAFNIGQELVKKFGSHFIITLSEHGVSFVTKDGITKNMETKAREVNDVTGAGDTFIAAFTLAYAASKSIEHATEVANHAAGIEVGHHGTVAVHKEELLRELK